jgi:integrase/recombinase XerD
MKHFKSFLAPQLNEYIAYREQMGYAPRNHRYYLLVFDAYLRDKEADWSCLQPAFFLEMRANLHMEPRSVNRILSTTRVFFNFLLRRESLTDNPVKDIPLLRENAIIPFVFSPKQTDQLLQAVCLRLRKTPNHFLADLALYLAVLLQARCGLRISEPLRLLPHHYRSDEGTIYIEKTKFKKDRLIPVPKAVMKDIQNYLVLRNTLCPQDPNPYLLAGRDQKPLTDQRFRRLFHQAIEDIGLHQPRRVIGNTNFSQPTPHSLRHSFAVNTLLAIRERGGCPQHALPILAAYMGHSAYKHTVKYLKVIDAQSREHLLHFAMRHQSKT